MPVAVVVKDQTNSAAVTSRVHYMHLQPRKCHCSNMGGVMPASSTNSVTLPPKRANLVSGVPCGKAQTLERPFACDIFVTADSMASLARV